MSYTSRKHSFPVDQIQYFPDILLAAGCDFPSAGKKKTLTFSDECLLESGNDLLSRAVSSQVPSTLKGLTSVFGMGTGGTPSLLSPEMVSLPGLQVSKRLPKVTCMLPLRYSSRFALPGFFYASASFLPEIFSAACCLFFRLLLVQVRWPNLDNCTLPKI